MGFRVGRIAGVELRIHWSTLIVYVLLVISLAGSQLPDEAPGRSDAAYVVAALLAGVAFWLALLAHEVSHAIVARHQGIEVESLTLWVLGGVAALRGEPRTPAADLAVGGVGPAVSLAIGGVSAAIAVLLDAAGGSQLIVATVAWLSGINLVLGVFNLVPAAPLDGGRVLRAGLWAWRKDRRWAAVAAARAGEVFGYLLIAAGVLLFFGPGLGGLWLVVLGWFLVNAARGEIAQEVLRDELVGVTVADVMTADPVTAPEDASVSEILDAYVMRTRHSAFPLRSTTGEVTGLVTLNRIREVPTDQRARTRARDVACPLDEIAVAAPEEPIVDVIPRLNACGDGRALVMRDGRLVGVLTGADVSRAIELASLRHGGAHGWGPAHSPGWGPRWHPDRRSSGTRPLPPPPAPPSSPRSSAAR